MFLLRLTSSDQTALFSFTSLTSNVRVAPPLISILRINQRRQLTKVLILVIEEFFCWLTWDRVSSPRITIGKMRRHHHSPTFSKTPGWFQTIVNVMRIPHSSFRKHTFQVAPPRSLGWFGLGREQMGLWCKIVVVQNNFFISHQMELLGMQMSQTQSHPPGWNQGIHKHAATLHIKL